MDDSSLPEVVTTSSLEAIARGESTTAVDIAKRYPRTISTFKQEALSLATMDQETAAQCFYFLPRGDGIYGPSVRLAEIVGATYGNIRVAARIIDIGKTHVTAQGAAWDMENNYHVTSEVQRSILTKHGKRYKDDMINVTCNAACSIARRNATFAAVPKAYWSAIYDQCRTVAVGDQRTIVEQVRRWLNWSKKIGVSDERLLLAMGVEDSTDLNIGHMKQLTGLATAITDGDTTIEEAFPEPEAEPVDGQKKTTKAKGRKQGGKSRAKPEPKPAVSHLATDEEKDRILAEQEKATGEPAEDWTGVGGPPMDQPDPNEPQK